MITIDDISPEFAELLRSAGWDPNRQVNTDEWVHILKREGFVTNGVALEILESLGNLVVRVPPAEISQYEHELRFDPARPATGESDRARDWFEQLGVALFPIGEESSSGNIIWVSSNGDLYYGRGFGLYYLGQSLRAGMDQLAFPKSSPTFCAEERACEALEPIHASA